MNPLPILYKLTLVTAILSILLITPARAADAPSPTWTDSYADALKQAKKDHKLLLLNFTGSDWCPYCVQLSKNVFSSPEFAKWANDKFLLVELDFPNEKPQTAPVRKQNKAMLEKYAVNVYPTVIILNPDEKELTRSAGYAGDKPDDWIKARDAEIAKAQSK